MTGKPPFGVYVHIPFCSSRCDYCAFATWDDRPSLVAPYLRAVGDEIGRAVEAGLPAADSVFFGGGTPSLVPAAELVSLLQRIPLSAGAEVTVECNPETVTGELVDQYLRGGVNRMSFGIQSMVPAVLSALGRRHDPPAAIEAVRLARSAGLPTWNVDLIYGAAGESADDWDRTLDEILALDPPHISAYGLTVEPGTPLAADPARHPDDDDQAARYLEADRRFAAAGLDWYEISNWSRPGHECRHNLVYWSQGDYRGFGCAAHSHEKGRRWWNVRAPERYIALVGRGRPVEAGAELLDEQQRRSESAQLALRTNRGVPSTTLTVGTGPGEVPRHLVDERDGRLVLTPAGRLLANEVSIRLH